MSLFPGLFKGASGQSPMRLRLAAGLHLKWPKSPATIEAFLDSFSVVQIALAAHLDVFGCRNECNLLCGLLLHTMRKQLLDYHVNRQTGIEFSSDRHDDSFTL